MVAQGQVIVMTTMVEKFLSWGRSIIQNFISLTPYTEEEDNIDARLATLDRKLMIHSFRNITLKSLEDEDVRMGGNESDYL